MSNMSTYNRLTEIICIEFGPSVVRGHATLQGLDRNGRIIIMHDSCEDRRMNEHLAMALGYSPTRTNTLDITKFGPKGKSAFNSLSGSIKGYKNFVVTPNVIQQVYLEELYSLNASITALVKR